VLLGPRGAARGALVEGRLDKPLIIDTLLPKAPERFPWAGHLGAKMVGAVAAEIEAASTTLVFTNTRPQAELWYQHLLRLRPEWAGVLAIHHGSLSRETRDWVEQGLKDGSLKAVVCTSSLDLGVDFLMSVMQASSGLFYDVFRKYDPLNGLLKQAEREVLEDELDVRRLQATLWTMSGRQLEVRSLKRPTPFGFPLMVDRLRERLSNETLSARIDRMVAQLEKAADA
jgi:Lhr-like helicase